MTTWRLRVAVAICLVSLFRTLAADAETEVGDDKDSRSSNVDTITVTATKLPEELGSVPAMLSVVTGEELRERHVQDLRTALAQLAGVDVAPGGDIGPAGSVPALW